MRGMRALLAGLLAVWAATAVAVSYDSGSFDTDAFSTGSFDLAPAAITVPDCTTSPTSSAACVSAVESAGLVADTSAACSDSVTSGDVVATAPPAGTEVLAGSIVSIYVSTGVACGDGGTLHPAGMGVGGMGVGLW